MVLLLVDRRSSARSGNIAGSVPFVHPTVMNANGESHP
jgi:hypothetical protein